MSIFLSNRSIKFDLLCFSYYKYPSILLETLKFSTVHLLCIGKNDLNYSHCTLKNADFF